MQPNTRLIRLFGITDYEGPLAVPSDDEEDEEDQPAPSKQSEIETYRKLRIEYGSREHSCDHEEQSG